MKIAIIGSGQVGSGLAVALRQPTEAGSQCGFKCEADALSDLRDPSGYSASDLISAGFIATPALTGLIEATKPVSAISPDEFDAIIVVGGQAPMFTFEKSVDLHEIFSALYVADKMACALCHGSAILRYDKLPNGEPLVRGRTVTGFANVEEDFADNVVWDMNALPRGTHLMPRRIEDELKALGANYVQAGLWRGFAMRDGNLRTGQQNFSGSETANALVRALGE